MKKGQTADGGKTSTEVKAGAVTGDGGGIEVPWNEKAPEYITGKDALRFSEDRLDYRKLNSLLACGKVHYMLRGRRLRVHFADLKAELARRTGTQGIKEQVAEAFGRYQEQFAKKQGRK